MERSTSTASGEIVDISAAAWQRSTKCEQGACVEVSGLGENVGLRNSTLPDVTISFPAVTWRDFIAGVRAGEFDRQTA
jgi:predicted secreted Zn-dependent protease